MVDKRKGDVMGGWGREPDEERDKESWRAGRQRSRTRRAIREHVEGEREEVKTEGRTLRENKRLKKEIKNNEGVTGLLLPHHVLSPAEAQQVATGGDALSEENATSNYQRMFDKRREKNEVINRTEHSSFVLFFSCLVLLDADITHTHIILGRRGLSIRHHLETLHR